MTVHTLNLFLTLVCQIADPDEEGLSEGGGEPGGHCSGQPSGQTSLHQVQAASRTGGLAGVGEESY